MGNRKQKKKKRDRSLLPSNFKCPNCGEKGPHFIPPSFGEKGFYICQYGIGIIKKENKELS